MRRALCVGIDWYTFGPLRGCVSDAEGIRDVLATHFDGSPNFDCRMLIAPEADKTVRISRPALRSALKELFGQRAEVALFHFSGHGTVRDLDGYLVTQDAAEYDEGLAMSEVLKLANESKAEEVLVLLDCCHSGNLGQVPGAIDNSRALLREGVSIMTASRGDQPSVEVGGRGLFTSLVLDALQGGAANVLGEVTPAGIYAFVEAAFGAWDQRPLYKSHVSKVITLRKCEPAIDGGILRKLPTYFPVPAEDKPLDPSFERTSPTRVPENVAVFSDLQSLNRVYLVVPVGAAHMYDAAMGSHACRLTASGRYYWRLAKNNRI